VSVNVNRYTTHVIANPDRKTTKVKKASGYPHIKIVNAEWMLQCCSRWEHVDETPYLIEIDAADRGGSPLEELDDTDIGGTGDEGGGDEANSQVQLDMSAEKWQSVDAEFQDFMDNVSDDTEEGSGSDSESVRSDASAQTDSKSGKRKRKRKTVSTDESGAEDSDDSVTSTSRLQRRKKRTMERVTSLTNVVSAEKSSGLPSPETTGPEEGQGEEEEEEGKVVKPTGLDMAGEEEDYDDGLEAEMLAEFEKTDEDA
jgi:RNA polymerase II subunit A-like phosphatase